MSDSQNLASRRASPVQRAVYTMPLRELASSLARAPAQILERLNPRCRSQVPASRRRLLSEEVREILESCGHTFKPRTVAFVNLKGGIGKTTSAVTIATRAVQYGYRTCLVDLDPQASATMALGMVPKPDDPVFHDVWQAPGTSAAGAVRWMEENFAILPSALENSLVDMALIRPAAQKLAVKGVCDAIHGMGIDLVIIDCPPSLGGAVISSACAADTVVIPLGIDAFSFRGVELTMDEVRAIRRTFGLPETRIVLLPTMVDRRLKLSAQAEARLVRDYGDYLLPGSIRTSTDFARVLERRETIFASSRKSQAKEDYDRITRSLLGLDGLFNHAVPSREQEA